MNKYINRIGGNKVSFVFVNDKIEIAKLEPIMEELSNYWQLSNEFCFNLNLVIEEVISNIIMHGSSINMDKLTISIIISNFKKHLSIEISDNSDEYNPLNYNTIPDNTKIENIKIGGLGIHFIKKLSSNQEYKRDGKNNILTLKLKKQ